MADFSKHRSVGTREGTRTGRARRKYPATLAARVLIAGWVLLAMTAPRGGTVTAATDDFSSGSTLTLSAAQLRL